jgi:hypothetical protein
MAMMASQILALVVVVNTMIPPKEYGLGFEQGSQPMEGQSDGSSNAKNQVHNNNNNNNMWKSQLILL